MHNRKIVMVIYANPDHYPPMISAIKILAKEFEIVVFCRNQEVTHINYPANVRIFRLGKLKTCKEKEAQGGLVKFFEYISFVMHVIIYTSFNDCRLIYSYDARGFVCSFFATHIYKRIPLIYHNFDMCDLGAGYYDIFSRLELKLARYVNYIVFPDINRAKFFQVKAKLNKLPYMVMNVPLRIPELPANRLKETIYSMGLSAGSRVVSYQGNITKRNALIEIIRSMAFWPKDAIFVILGMADEDLLKELKHEARLYNVDGRLFFLPYVAYSQLFHYTVGAYLGLALYMPVDLNSIFNAGASNKIYEYISLGIPVVTNDSPYFREVIDSSLAYFAKPDSPEDIAKAVNSAFSDTEEYHRKSQAAREAHLTRLNYQEQFKPVFDYIREVVSK